MRYGFVIDQRKCIGCHACTTACKSEHQVPLGVFRTWVKSVEKGSFPNTRRHFLVERCNHCENAPCVKICPTKALYKRPDGIVDFNRDSCIGCKSCMEACPYEALYIDPATDTAAKCNYCAHRVEAGLQPACVVVCPEQAIISGDLEDPTSKIAQLIGRENVQVRKPEKGTKPQLFYIGADQTAVNPEATASSIGYMWSQPNTHLHGRETPPVPVAPAYRPLNFAEMLTTTVEAPAGAGSADGGGEYDYPTMPPPKGRTLIPLAEVKTTTGQVRAASVPSAAPSPHLSVAAGLLSSGTDAQVNYNISHERPWGFLVALYLWTKSIGAGAFMILALALGFGLASDTLLFNWLAPVVGLVFIALTTALLVLDLRHPERFHYILLRSNWTSWLVLGAYILMAYSAVMGLWLLERLLGWTGLESILLWPGVILAIMAAGYSAFLFGQAKGRDFWQSPLLAPHLLIQATLGGSGVLLILGFITGTNSTALGLLVWTLLAAIVANLTVVLSELFVPHVNNHATRAAHVLRSGRLSQTFWWGFILVGALIPLGLLITSLLLSTSALPAALGALLAVAGLLIYERIWIIAGQEVPLS
ncbi:MAG TPA: 4Fe-4S dicluster domain-containing protein [Chloroflexia bacterium]|nr:4Fe-4S dicluster domain-containing protein [Chloroflexia bacterium]